MNNESAGNFGIRFNAFAGKAGIVVAILLFPFLFKYLFATGALRTSEFKYLLLASIFFLMHSLIMIRWRKKIPAGYTLLLFSVLLLISMELITRLSVKLFASDTTVKTLNEEGNWTYSESSAYTGHPFIQFSGKPSVALKGNKALGNLSPFNNFGFVGADFTYKKPSNIIRIACLGESTTADGYPAFLEKYLNDHRKNSAWHFEVLNFGHAYWTTNHSVVNFILNVIDFSPDVIVLHHGWNEEKIRNTPKEEFRGDYSHVFKSFGAPKVYDRYIIRVSVIYRFFKFSYDKAPAWAFLSGSIQKERKVSDLSYSNTDELKPYKRNLESIIHLALTRKMKVILTTLPRTTNQEAPMFYGFKSLDQCNTINRELAREFADKILFVDLDSQLTGKHNEIFQDLAHVDDAGRTMKAEAIGNGILSSLDNDPLLYQNRQMSAEDREGSIQFYMARIRSSPEWLKDIQKKANDRKVSLEEMIRIDAVWLMQQDSIQMQQEHKKSE